jgi:hypothetical protein
MRCHGCTVSWHPPCFPNLAYMSNKATATHMDIGLRTNWMIASRAYPPPLKVPLLWHTSSRLLQKWQCLTANLPVTFRENRTNAFCPSPLLTCPRAWSSMRPICVWADILLKTLQLSSIQQSVHEKTYPLHASPTLSIYLKSTSDRIWLHNFQLHLSAPFTCISHISILWQLKDTTLHLLQHLASVSTKLLFPTKCTQLPTALNDVLQDNSHISVRTT